jgi:hypothetical protein
VNGPAYPVAASVAGRIHAHLQHHRQAVQDALAPEDVAPLP